MEETWKITRIFDTNKVLKKQFEDGSIFVELVHSSVSMSDSIQAMHEKYSDEYRQKEHGKLVSREVITFPLAREVTLLAKGTCFESKRRISVIVRNDRFPILYELLESHHKGVRLVSREEKYRNLHQVYEHFSEKQDIELKSIRHSLSHTRKKMTDKKTTEILHSLFGDTKIDLSNCKHAKVFQKKLELLRGESEKLVIKEILKIMPSSKNFLGVYYMPSP